MAHPFSKDTVQRISEGMSHASKRKQKDSEVLIKFMLTGRVPKFVPLVFVHFGNWGNEMDKFLDEMSTEGRSNECEFRNRWRRHILMLLHKCNSSVILKKLTKLLYGRAI